MNIKTKNILYGIGTFVLVIVILAVVRSLKKGVGIEQGFMDWTNWALAAASGICTGWSSYSKAKAKEEKEKKDDR